MRKVICPFCSSPVLRGRPEIINTTLPGAKHYVYQGFSDPSEVDGSGKEKIAAFRRTRNDVEKWILEYFVDLKAEGVNSHE